MAYHLVHENRQIRPESQTYTVDDIAAILKIGRSTAYKLAKSGELKTVRIGNAIRISRKDFERWFDQTD